MTCPGLRVKERKRRSVLQKARADGDGMRRPPWALEYGSGEGGGVGEGGGEEARSVRCMCDVCAAHGDSPDLRPYYFVQEGKVV